MSGHRIFVLDGDGLRNGLCRDLDFSREARRENLRRAAEVAKIMLESGTLVIASFISPFREERQMVREIIGEGFFEVYMEASLKVCESRDPKGLYSRARAGIIPEFTGVSSPYEPPPAPDMRVNTAARSIDDCARQLLGDMARAGLLRKTRFDRYFAEKKGSSPYVVQRN
jgi:adenylylsulfate kinase